MSKQHFQIALTGDVKPDTTRASDLADFIKSFEEAVLETAKAAGLALSDDDGISLVNIEEGSNRLSVAVPALLVAAVSTLSISISKNSYAEIPFAAHEKLYEISKQAIRKGWGVSLRGDISSNIANAEISPSKPVPEPQLALVSGATVLCGTVELVGGQPPRIYLRLPNQERLRVETDEPFAKLLGDRLYETVCIEGEGSWKSGSWTVEKFKAQRVTEYTDTDPLQAFEQLANASKGRWDGVDVVRYLKDIRSDEGTS